MKLVLSLLWQALCEFRHVQGFVLAGAVAYNTLISLIPLVTLLLIVLSLLFDPDELLQMVEINLALLLPTQAEELTAQFATFLAHRELLGWLSVAVMLFFSSLAFTVLENAVSLIFHHRVGQNRRRHFLISAIIPYVYIVLLGLGLMLITLLNGAVQLLDQQTLTIGLWEIALHGVSGWILYLCSLAGVVALLTSVYMVMPLGRLPWSYALIGGVTATLLWELVRHVMVWYFTKLSLVNLIYGSLTTAVVTLLFLEVGAIILLFGAEVIAVYERMHLHSAEVGSRRDEKAAEAQ